MPSEMTRAAARKVRSINGTPEQNALTRRSGSGTGFALAGDFAFAKGVAPMTAFRSAPTVSDRFMLNVSSDTELFLGTFRTLYTIREDKSIPSMINVTKQASDVMKIYLFYAILL